MDFIKIPELNAGGVVTDMMLRISQIDSIVCFDKETTIIMQDGSRFTSPMSVAKINDLIWENEHASVSRTEMKPTKDAARELGCHLINDEELKKAITLLRESIIGNPKSERLERVLRILENAY